MARMRFNAQWFFSTARFQSIAVPPFRAAGVSLGVGGVGMNGGEEKGGRRGKWLARLGNYFEGRGKAEEVIHSTDQ
jgi:hypothetical protein